MKRLLVLSIMLALGSSFVGATSFAQEDDSKRTVNPGDDPNEARSSEATESSVSATGICRECIARRFGAGAGYGSRPMDNTNSRISPFSEGKGGSSGSTGSESGVKGTR